MTTPARSTEPTDVYLEVGTKRVFACALVWPGTGTSFAGFHFLSVGRKEHPDELHRYATAAQW
jgi:hypothetical protein